MSEVIPDAAVEAAAKADYGDGWDRASEWERSAYLDHSKLLLEAAAPHMSPSVDAPTMVAELRLFNHHKAADLIESMTR
jgi:hypothetical protein